MSNERQVGFTDDGKVFLREEIMNRGIPQYIHLIWEPGTADWIGRQLIKAADKAQVEAEKNAPQIVVPKIGLVQ